ASRCGATSAPGTSAARSPSAPHPSPLPASGAREDVGAQAGLGLVDRMRTMSGKLFNKVALIGIGLIGSSLARAFRRESPETEIIACARRAETLAAVRRLAIADATTRDPAQAAAAADLVVIATPLSAYAELGERIAPVL